MRYVWLLATTLFITTEAHAFRHMTCDLLFQVRIYCPTNDHPECRPEVLTGDEERETYGNAPTVNIAFEVLNDSIPQSLLTKGFFNTGETTKFTYDEQREVFVEPEYKFATLHLSGFSEDVVMKYTAAGSTETLIWTFECTEVKP